MRGRGDGRVQQPLKKPLGSVNFQRHLAHFLLRWHEADLLREQLMGVSPSRKMRTAIRIQENP